MTQRLRPAARALRLWGPRQWGVAALAGLATALVLGLTAVLVPHDVLGLGIPPGWWTTLVRVATSALTGVLVASYVAPVAGGTPLPEDDGVAAATVARAVESGERRSALLGVLAVALAVGGGVLPGLGVLALVIAASAVVHRLSGQLACPVNLPVRTARNTVVPEASETPDDR